MTKKQQRVTLEEALNQPWCFYCDRTFVDMKVLQDHQKQMHFQCQHCRRRLNTIGGLKVHSEQVHKEHITKVDNCGVEGRDNPDIEVFCMEGIPAPILEARKEAISQEFHRREMEWRMKTGNPISGPNPNAGKRKADGDGNIDTQSVKERVRELKRRKAEKAAAEAAAQSSNHPPGTAINSGADAHSHASQPHSAPNGAHMGGADHVMADAPALAPAAPSPAPPLSIAAPPPSITPVATHRSGNEAPQSTEEKMATWHTHQPRAYPQETTWLSASTGLSIGA